MSPFAMIKIDVLRSGLLTLEELGLYVMMLSRPDNWEFSEFVLARELGTTPREVHDLLKRLERKGFARERQGRYGTVWDLFELSEQLQRGEPYKDYTVPQSVAKTFVDSILQKETNASQNTGNAKPDVPQQPECVQDAGQPMTREQIGQTLMDYAKKLKQDAAARKAGATDLPNGSGSGIMQL